MKKYAFLLATLLLALSLMACAGSQAEASPSSGTVESSLESGSGASSLPEPPEEEPSSQVPPADAAGSTDNTTQSAPQDDGAASSVLVAYFSWADNAILDAEVDVIASPSVVAPGNVQQLAGWVQEATGGDLFAIRVTEPYSSDWDECLDRANQERGDDARPALEERVENLEQYDTVFLGYPNWWYGVPMALLTFLEENDLSGKEVYLFCSHGTGGLARSVEIITDAAPDAAISDDIFHCYEEDAPSSREGIQAWVSGLGYTRPSAPERGEGTAAGQLSVTWGDNRVLYALNDSPAAQSLLEQLPLTTQVEDYSTNEKIFYPPQELDTSDTPAASGGAGTLAYYAPWGDVVMFYGDYSENPSLFALGQIVSGEELVPRMSGTITIAATD